jgi:hypothetical protein
MVFCASLAPCPKDRAAAETNCRPLKLGWSSCSLKIFCTRNTMYMRMNAIVNATSGLAMMPMAAFCTLLQEMAPSPPAAIPAPTRPPMMAWLDEDGIPMYHVM